MSRVFVNGPGDQRSIPGHTKDSMVLDADLLNTQHYKVRIKGKVEQSKERSSVLPYTSMGLLLKGEPLGPPRLKV